jgi:SAM-dependent methyltransferase
MGAYASAAEFYDLLYAGQKDYVAEATLLGTLVRDIRPTARSVLDVACGTGAHARALLDAGFQVVGVDLEPAFVAMARTRCPEGEFHVADMTAFRLPARFDAVMCLFGSIGYARTERALGAAIARMRAHLQPGGVLVVDPWLEPGQLTHGRVMALVGTGTDVTVCRMSRTVVDGLISRLEFEYVIGTAGGLERRSERHELGLFTERQMTGAFAAAGLEVERRREALGSRDLYVATAP